MIRNRILLKSLTVFFIVEILVSTIVPSLSWALTAGPTAPEYTSFEPVDVTDMVNISTGDFVYNLPLFEVPGPSGGFPISMSYHAGIQPDMEASWVGLGWSLQTGAVNRSVDGTPDDFSGVSSTERTFWEGGKSIGLTTGVTYGPVTASLSYSSDTYRGMSIGANLASSNGIAAGSIGANYSVDAYGKEKFSQASSLKSSTQLQFDKIKGGYDVVSGGLSSIKTAAGNAFLSKLPVSFANKNGKEGNIRTRGFDFNADIPIQPGLSIQLGARYRRYWIDERTNSYTYGSIHFPNFKPHYEEIEDHNYDITDLQYLESGELLNEPDKISLNPSKGLAGSFPTYDSYNVTGQGIGGSIRPYHLKSYLYRPTTKNDDNQIEVQPYPLGGNKRPEFRFVNDFSNNFLYDQDDFQIDLSNSNPLTYQFNNQKITTGDNSPVNGYVNDALAGSRNIKYFNKSQVFGNFALGYTSQNSAPDNSIGGFIITNESGVNYHYKLPVYSYDEYTYTGSTDFKNIHRFNLYKRTTPYAYTWLLTAMTGPDYVDVNNDGTVSEGDTGYWIRFEYGKWTKNYNWRNPHTGYVKDVDHLYDFFSKGKKEIYYLNAIRSATHTALFVKELRADGKGVVHEIEPAVKINTAERKVEKIDQGGFEPVTYDANDVRHPASTLRLKEILLFKNSDLEYSVSQLASRSTTYDHSFGINTYHYGSNVIDVHDISDIREALLLKSIQSVRLNHDYSLSPDTPNSFISAIDGLNSSSSHLSETDNGKLKLKSVEIIGKEGISLLPPIQFGYEVDPSKTIVQAAVDYLDTDDPADGKIFKLRFSSADFDIGDIVKLSARNMDLYAVILSDAGGEMTFQSLADRPLRLTVINTIEKTKNPPYSNTKRDIWGFYKSDYIDFGHENISRMTSDVSSKGTDVWSMRSIKMVTGAEVKIDFESDRYDNSIKKVSSVVIKSVEVHDQASNLVKVTTHGRNARNVFKDNDLVKIHGVFRRDLIRKFESNKCDCGSEISLWKAHESAYTPIIERGDNYIIIQDASLVTNLNTPEETVWIDCNDLSQQHFSTTNQAIKPYLGFTPYKFIGGEIQFNTNAGTFSLGGGLRVREISIKNQILNSKSSILYEYKQGVTPYEPLGMDVNIARLPGVDVKSCIRDKETQALEEYKQNFTLKVAYKNMLHLFANSRLMPGPGVMYADVSVRESIQQSDGTIHQQPNYNTYSFVVFNPKLVDIYNKGLTSSSVSDKGYKLFSPFPTGNFRGAPTTPVQGLPVQQVITNTVAIQDFSSVIGTLKSVTSYDLENRKISETSYQYLFDEMDNFNFDDYRKDLMRYNNQGLVEEVFADAKLARRDDNTNYNLIGILSKYSQFPSIQVSSRSVNYKTGVSQENENVLFDHYSGQVTETLSRDEMGNYFNTQIIPAYRQYPSLGLGISNGKNMLVQPAGQTIYKAHLSYVNQNGELLRKIIKDGLLGASAQTWSNSVLTIKPGDQNTFQQPGIWRNQSSYSFIGNNNVSLLPDGSYPMNHFSNFDSWNSSNATEGWQKNSEVRLYDVYSHALEASDVNENYAVTKMSYDHSMVLATGTNGGYYDFAYSGAEDLVEGKFGGNISIGEGQLSTNKLFAHTGDHSLSLHPHSRGFVYQVEKSALKNVTSQYSASVWVRGNSPGAIPQVSLVAETESGLVLGSASPTASRKAGDWYLINLDFNLPASNNDLIKVYVANNSAVGYYIDDFRFHPLNAAMNSYVYNGFGELTHILDNNNLYTEYRYDAMGRLIETHKETFGYGVVKTSKVIYHYAGQ